MKERMKVSIVKQISVFLEDAAGRLEEMTGVLGAAGINISAISVAENAGYGIVRMVISHTEEAEACLKKADFMVNITDVLCVEIPDEPGSLAKVFAELSRENINVSYMYGYSRENVAPMIIKVDDPGKALELFS